MGFDEGQVIFDNDRETYFAGQTVHGKLVFKQTKVKTFRGLYVVMKGYCNCHWTTRHSRRVNDRTEHYTKHHNSHETYYEQKVYLMGKQSGESHLNPGTHEFAFQCHIPPHCPSSFEGSNGHIRYEFKFVVDRAFKFDQEKVKTITVIAKRDLNVDPYCKEPIEFEFRESYCCCCVGAGSCELTINVPQSGFCPGQIIPIEVSCANKSTVDIDSIKFSLNEDITFRATSEPDTRSESDVLAKIKKGPILGNTTRNWTLEMEIPEMDLYNVDACNYIDIDYEFEVSMSPSGCHEGTSASRRIVLGHVPLRDSEDEPPEQINKQPAELQQYPAPNQPYPGGHTGYPNGSPYPGANPPYPNANPSYPGANPPYPGANPPYPGANPPYPGANPPYPGTNSPYPGGNPPYPGQNPPYPGANPPYPSANPPYPGTNPPYPTGSLFPGGNQTFPVPSPVPPSLGFAMSNGDSKNELKVPLLPPGASVPYPTSPSPASPFATASAPEPSTPDFDGKKPMLEEQAHPYNPDFVKEDKKPE